MAGLETDWTGGQVTASPEGGQATSDMGKQAPRDTVVRTHHLGMLCRRRVRGAAHQWRLLPVHQRLQGGARGGQHHQGAAVARGGGQLPPEGATRTTNCCGGAAAMQACRGVHKCKPPSKF